MKIKAFLLLLFLFMGKNAFNQAIAVHHWEALFNSDAYFMYWSSNNGNADKNWRAVNFDDSDWDTGKGGIGFGDGDDLTQIAPCRSVSIRKSFTITDKSKILEAKLYIDYDDTFVAYLNGVEIARSSGLTQAFPNSDQLSSIQREAGAKERYTINRDTLSSYLINGKNTIAIQVHNVSDNSTDLSSAAWFFVGMSSIETTYQSTPQWFQPEMEFTSSNLPILIIDTENGSQIPDEPKINAHLGVIYNGEGQINYLSDLPNHYNGNIGIELRGNSTQGMPKKPYNFETRNDLGENLNVPFFGWPAENDWVLNASYFDHTFIRNPLAMYMSNLMGHWASRCKMVEVVLNGEYEGIYIFMEKIKVDKGRLNLSKLIPNEITEPNISGGYIYEISGFNNDLGEQRSLKYPKFKEAAPQQIDYITQYDNKFRNTMQSRDYTNELTGYRAWIDVNSFVDELLVQEAMRNSDAYGWSGYFHKDKNKKLCAGPVWDFDQSAGNSSYPDNGVIDKWLFSHIGTYNTPFFWALIFQDPRFQFEVKARWEELRNSSFQNINLLWFVDSIADLLYEPQLREFNRWPVLGAYIFRETTGFQDRDTYQKEVDYLKSFLTARWRWMDNELAKIVKPNSLYSGKNMEEFMVYPNPAKEIIIFEFKCIEPFNAKVHIYSSMGTLMEVFPLGNLTLGINTIPFMLDNKYKSGVYFYTMLNNNEPVYKGKFIVVK